MPQSKNSSEYETIESASEESHELSKLSGIGIAAFIGGGFAAGFLIYENYKLLGLAGKARQTIWIFGCIGLLFLYVAWNTPPDLISAMLSIGIPQLVIILISVKMMQGSVLSLHMENDGKFRSNRHALAIGIAVNLLIKAGFYGISLLR